MPFRLGESANPVREGERLPKVSEPVRFFEMMFPDHVPPLFQLFPQGGDGFSLQGGDSSTAGDALFMLETGHRVLLRESPAAWEKISPR